MAARTRTLVTAAAVIGLVAGCSSTVGPEPVAVGFPSQTGAPAASSPAGSLSPTSARSSTAGSTGSPSPMPGPLGTASSSAGQWGAPVATTVQGRHAGMTVRVGHRSLPTATLLTVAVQVRSGSGYLNGFAVSFGNEQSYRENPVAAACPMPRPSSSPTPEPASTATRTVLVSYRFPGVYQVTVTAQADQAECGETRYPGEQLRTIVTVRVTAGRVLANGPQLPAVPEVSGDPSVTHPEPGTSYLLAGTSGDPDGFISRYIWTWGDGSPPVTSPVPAGLCRDDGRSWPTAGDATADSSHTQHHYARPGRYLVQVTVVSSGCRGQDSQSVTGKVVISAGTY